MNWTTELPTKPGWYWWRKYPDWEMRIVQVVRAGERLEFDGWGVQYQGGLYAGPIPEPTLASTPQPRTFVLGNTCPTCGSPRPHLHPAMQFEGEVQECGDEFHKISTPQPRTLTGDGSPLPAGVWMRTNGHGACLMLGGQRSREGATYTYVGPVPAAEQEKQA